LEMYIRTDTKARNEEETRTRKLDGDTVNSDTGWKKNERNILCPRARSVSQDCIYLSQ